MGLYLDVPMIFLCPDIQKLSLDIFFLSFPGTVVKWRCRLQNGTIREVEKRTGFERGF